MNTPRPARPPSRRARLLLALATGALAAACLAPASALAVHVLKGSFGETGHGDGQLELLAPVFKFTIQETPGSNLALNEESHDVYVADTGNHRVDQFSQAGTFIRAFGADVGGAGVDVCTTGCVAGTPGKSPGAFETPTLIAVDNDPLSPSHGDVYVADTGASLITKFKADGALVSSWGVGGQLDGSTATTPIAGPFAQIAGIAVDSAGNLDVLENGVHVLFKFSENGTFVTDFATPRESAPGGLGIDPAGNFFKLNGTPTVEKVGSTGTDIGQVTKTEPSTGGLAVDPLDGDVYRDTGTSVEQYHFNGSGEVIQENSLTCTPAPLPFVGCERTATFGSGHLTSGAGVAVDSAHTVYVADAGANKVVVFVLVTAPTVITEAANPVGATEATLKGTVNPNGLPLKSNPAEGCFFEYDTTEYNKEEAPHGEVAPCEAPDAEEVGNGNAPVPVHAEVSGLKTGTTYHFRLLAANSNASAEGEDEELHTHGPGIKGEAALGVTDTAATLSGLIDPNGEATGFFFEYVSEADFLASEYEEAISVPEPPGEELGAGSGFEEVSRQISGLAPDTAYRFRLIAANPSATVQGEDKRFATLPQAPPGLPDGRAYEMVTPAAKLGEPFPPEPGEFLGGTCKPECSPGGSEVTTMPMQSTADGSAFVYEGQPFAENLRAGANQYLANRGASGWETEGLSSPLFDGKFKAFSADLARGILIQEQPLTPEAPARGGLGFLNLYLWQEGALQPVLVEEPPQRDPGSSGPNRFKLSYEAANAGAATVPALSHVLFAANDALTEKTPFAPAAPEVGAGGGGSGCNVGDNCNLYEWDEGQLRLVNVLPGNADAAPGAVIGSRPSNNEPPDVDHAISDDGSRIFWSDESGQVYVRIDGEETREIKDPGEFATASADGSKVLLEDGCLYELAAETCVEDLTLDQGAVHQGGFSGLLGASEDLSRVYFVDTKVLSGGEENANGEKAVEKAGKFNLYAWSEGATSFIGTLLAVDKRVVPILGGQYGDWTPSSARRTAQVSADGRHLAFMSQAPLSGYEENKVNGGGKCGRTSGTSTCFEVFAYNADAGSLACPSCNPSGQRPLGPASLSLFANPIPGSQAALPPPHNLTTDGQGRLFFESQDVLSTHDTNGHIQDVYEWEPDGVGSCTRPAGCVFLISSGHDPGDSMFVNSTPSGNDAFFTTRERLLPRDKDDFIDIYDARVNGGIAEEEAPICAGEACKGPLSAPPVQQGPGSSTFSGPGNQKPKHHRRHKHKKRHQRHKSHTRHRP